MGKIEIFSRSLKLTPLCLNGSSFVGSDETASSGFRLFKKYFTTPVIKLSVHPRWRAQLKRLNPSIFKICQKIVIAPSFSFINRCISTVSKLDSNDEGCILF